LLHSGHEVEAVRTHNCQGLEGVLLLLMPYAGSQALTVRRSWEAFWESAPELEVFPQADRCPVPLEAPLDPRFSLLLDVSSACSVARLQPPGEVSARGEV
jgi:hypothetical protein